MCCEQLRAAVSIESAAVKARRQSENREGAVVRRSFTKTACSALHGRSCIRKILSCALHLEVSD